jgi:hypothetical protein
MYAVDQIFLLYDSCSPIIIVYAAIYIADIAFFSSIRHVPSIFCAKFANFLTLLLKRIVTYLTSYVKDHKIFLWFPITGNSIFGLLVIVV